MRRIFAEMFRRLSGRGPGKELFPVKVERWRGIANAFGEFPESPSILVLKVDHIGDFLTALEAFSKLRDAWPRGTLTLVCGSWNVELARATGLFDRIVAFDFYPPSHAITHQPRVAEKVRAFAALGLGPFDLAVDLREDWDCRPLMRAACARFKAGFATREERDVLDLALLDTEAGARTAGVTPLHAETRLSLLAEAVVATFKDRRHPLASRLVGRGAGQTLPAAPYVVICVASGSPLKRWPRERFAELARRLAAQDHRIVLAGGANDAPEAEAIAQALEQRVVNLTGRVALEDLAPLLAQAELYVGLDTGPTHLAAYLGVPTLAIYSGTCDPNVWMPRGPRVRVLRAVAPCSPCGLRELGDCKRAVPCIAEVGADDALAAAQELLGASGAERPHLPLVRSA